MSLLVYLPRKFDQTHEREQYRNVCKLLKARYHCTPDELCIFVANFNIGDVELDGLLIKNDGISILEFKDYGGRITAAENGDWKGASPDGRTFIVKGGSGRKNPYSQAKINRNAFKSAVVSSGALNEEQAKGLSSIILFHQSCEFDNHISAGIRWIKVVDECSLIDCFDDIVTPNLDLGASDFLNIIRALQLDKDWLQNPYSDLNYLEREIHDDERSDLKEPDDSQAVDTGDTNPSEEESASSDFGISSDGFHENYQTQNVGNANKENMVDVYYSLFSMLGIDVAFELLDIRAEALPLWARRIEKPDAAYMIISSLDTAQKKRIEECRHVEIRTYKGMSYWFEPGDLVPHAESETKDPTPENEEIPDSGKMASGDNEVSLPKWFESILFEKLGAVYSPDNKKFSYNLDKGIPDVKTYLGTYFPRSFAESYLICRDLLSVPELKGTICSGEHIDILDIGCGTGGSVIGLLAALSETRSNIKTVSIKALDGNSSALKMLNEVVNCINSHFKFSLSVEYAPVPMENMTDMSILDDLIKDGYDFILCFKMVNEILSHEIISSDAYYNLAKMLASKISDSGLFVLLDVTTKDDRLNEFYPVLLNHEINRFIQEDDGFASLVPVSCHVNEARCPHGCYSQRIILVNHCKKSKDRSKISYRVICRRTVSDLVPAVSNSKVCVHNKYGTPVYCTYTKGENERGGFILNYK